MYEMYEKCVRHHDSPEPVLSLQATKTTSDHNWLISSMRRNQASASSKSSECRRPVPVPMLSQSWATLPPCSWTTLEKGLGLGHSSFSEEKSERNIQMSFLCHHISIGFTKCIPNISQNLATAISAAHANLGKSTDDRGERHSARLNPWRWDRWVVWMVGWYNIS